MPSAAAIFSRLALRSRLLLLLRIGGLTDAQPLGRVGLGQTEVLPPGADRCGAVDAAADHVMRNHALLGVAGRDIVCIGDDDKAGSPLGPLMIWMLVGMFIAFSHFLNLDNLDGAIPVNRTR